MIEVSLVTVPMIFEAEHRYPPACAFPVTVQGILRIMPFGSLVQVMVGSGLPSAVQLRVNVSTPFRVAGAEM